LVTLASAGKETIILGGGHGHGHGHGGLIVTKDTIIAGNGWGGHGWGHGWGHGPLVVGGKGGSVVWGKRKRRDIELVIPTK